MISASFGPSHHYAACGVILPPRKDKVPYGPLGQEVLPMQCVLSRSCVLIWPVENTNCVLYSVPVAC